MTSRRSAESTWSSGPTLELSVGKLRSIVERVVRSSLKGDSAACDVTQEAMVQVLRGLKTVRDPTRLEPWVATVAAYTVRRELRRRRRSARSVSMHDSASASELAYCPDPEHARILRKLDAALAKLPHADRTLLLERASCGGTMRATAMSLGCSLSTLQRRLGRARERLCRIMSNDAELRDLGSGAFRSRARAAEQRPNHYSRRTL